MSDGIVKIPALYAALALVAGVVASYYFGLTYHIPLAIIIAGGILFWVTPLRALSAAIMVVGVGALALSLGEAGAVSDSIEGGGFVEATSSIASRRLDMLGLSSHARSVGGAISLGERWLLDGRELAAYQRSGAAHFLALSGLHVAIVFALINSLLRYFVLLRYGHLLKGVISIAMIWLYALVVGMPESVVRAAVMFSFYVAAQSLSLPYVGLNILGAAIFVMVIASPMVVWSVGFQLSVIAVAAIFLWALPICRAIAAESRFVKWTLSSVVISLCCTVALAPLSALYFNYIPIIGLLFTPLFMLTVTLILTLCLCWVLVPLPMLAPFVALPIESAVMVQAALARVVSSLKWGGVELSITPDVAAMVYAIYLLITIIARDKKVRYLNKKQ